MHQLAAQSFPQARRAAHDPTGSFRSQPPWAGGTPQKRARVGGANQASLTAIGFAAFYVFIAMTTHFALIGIVPVMAAIHAVRRRERLAPLAAVAAAVALLVGISALAQ